MDITHLGRGSTADEKRNFETQFLHFTGYVNHFVERWSDQPGKAKKISLFGYYRL